MTRTIRFTGSFLLCALALLLAASPSSAINLVGNAGVAAPDPQGTFTVVVGVPGAVVVVNFSACGQMDICSAQAAGQLVGCAANTVTSVANAVGVATFTIVGRRGPVGAVLTVPCATITADGVPIGPARRVAAFDNDGIGGVNAIDLGLFASDLFAGTNLPRSDFDENGVVNALDLGRFAAVLFGGGSVASCGVAYCP